MNATDNHAAIRERLAKCSLWSHGEWRLFQVHFVKDGEVFGVQYTTPHGDGTRVRLPLEGFAAKVAEGLHEITKEEEAALLAEIDSFPAGQGGA